jgi:hypothetical protein
MGGCEDIGGDTKGPLYVVLNLESIIYVIQARSMRNEQTKASFFPRYVGGSVEAKSRNTPVSLARRLENGSDGIDGLPSCELDDRRREAEDIQ